jgi:hypothetical protein
MKKLPSKYMDAVLALIMTMIMTAIVCAVSTVRALGFHAAVIHVWFISWLLAWAIAFPTLLIILPFCRKAARHFVETP